MSSLKRREFVKTTTGATVAAIVDVDENFFPERLKWLEKNNKPKPEVYIDIRKMLEDKHIDAISVANQNHWHALAGFWAVQAGKHATLEKPGTHNVFESRQFIKAQKKYGKMIQHHAERRTCAGFKSAVDFLHSGGLKVYVTKKICYKWRKSIGKKQDAPVPPGVHCSSDRSGFFSIAFLLLYGLLLISAVYSQPLSHGFELRYFDDDPKANGITDFKGETATFSLAERIEYLKIYERIAAQFFGNPNWDQKVVSDKEALDISAAIKPQPRPSVRHRFPLKRWKALGFKTGQDKTSRERLAVWRKQAGVTINKGRLLFKNDTRVQFAFPEQVWRCFFYWRVKPVAGKEQRFQLGDLSVLIDADGIVRDDHNNRIRRIEKDKWLLFKFELDFESNAFNLYIDDKKCIAWQSLDQTSIDRFDIVGPTGLLIDDLWGLGFGNVEFTDDTHSRDIPYTMKTFLFERFTLKPSINGWMTQAYNDSLWQTITLPHPHGGERFAGEDLYLRQVRKIGSFKRAFLNIETLDPGGQVWINGEVVHVQHHSHPVKLDVTAFLRQNTPNIIALRVFPNRVNATHRHTSQDTNTGWFAGRAWLDLTADQTIDDVFVYTRSIAPTVQVHLDAMLMNRESAQEQREIKQIPVFKGSVKVDIYPWFPQESESAVFSQTFPVRLKRLRDVPFSRDIYLKDITLWTPENPVLYRVVLTLQNEQNEPVDDYVVATGFRTISQEGGTFRINGRPAMMNGALLFSYNTPEGDIARTLRCTPREEIVKEMMMIKRMHGNTIRMSVHNEVQAGINDPRYAEIGDQLGILFQWSTASWVRTATPWWLDFEGLPQYVRQVRNHPSIIMWQPANHPKFADFENEGAIWFKRVYDRISAHDPSRLICPTANIGRIKGKEAPNAAGTFYKDGTPTSDFAQRVWTLPLLTRGNMDHATGYRSDWSDLRNYPYPDEFADEQGWRQKGFRVDYLNSPDKAYFDFESEESVGIPNQTLKQGKPSYNMRSYEIAYDPGYLGRVLDPKEWRISQAWQGLSAYEAYRKKRWLDYDGQAWCPLHGGGNMATYEKPLIDYYGHGKISWHTVGMVFQTLLAGSKNVDIVYGPKDDIPVMVLNCGPQKRVNVDVLVKTIQGDIVAEKQFDHVILEQGRTVTDLSSWKPAVPETGYYMLEYIVKPD